MNEEVDLTPFNQLRDLAKSIKSQEDAKEKIMEIIPLISQINYMFIDISIKRQELSQKLQDSIEKAKEKQFQLEAFLQSCICKAESNIGLKEIADNLNIKDDEIISAEELKIQQGLTDEQFANLSEKEILFKRIEFQHSQIKTINEENNNARGQKSQLNNELAVVKKKYSSIVSKMQKMYDEINGFLTKIK